MSVDFLIAGAQKCGTSALNRYLDAHPNLCMARKKEMHFFDNEDLFTDNTVDYSRYHSYFSPRLRTRLYGEATPNYLYWYSAPRRIWEYNPAMKIIIILRNPIDRAFSAWNMEVIRKREFLPFPEAIRTETQRCGAALPFQHRVYAYVDRGYYTDQIRRFRHYFPEKQMLFLKSEHLRKNPQAVSDRICKFLGIAKMRNIKPITVHAHPYETPMSDADRAYLKKLYEFEINDLEQLLGWDCSGWLASS